ncbi:LysR family transcriptional regulator [Gallionella capsiferriformans]|jgi:DNA-binding transcriptional LysR family regulator|uniref:Transcriptional regulator, LysR family n=1 Tax=Gallionella capsiferriformans (strain ES-2) TaxID=395494 RepID=D9SG58_GALCS|nr:LysR family transcriptional regulator [Gallionella capsiferriformans]ADL55505.1 transcriptional regulator, LysR family [Gallionella capsiferriformans ES-2]
MDRLTAMRVFVEVAQRGSFTAAADSLDISRAMATRYVSELEQWLNARLLQRSTRRLSLTEAGERCLLQCRQILELSGEMTDVSGRDNSAPKGPLRITTSMSFGMAHLAAAVTDYLKLYPQVSVDMLMVDRSVNLIEERIDLAIRISGELDPNLVTRRLAPCRSVVCASPDYLRRYGTPASPADLTRHNCLTYSNFGKGQWRFARAGQEIEVPVSGNLSANEATVLTQAALAGAGLALQPTYLAGPLIRSGQLSAVLPEWEPPELGICGVYVSRRHMPATLRTLIDFLVQRYAGVPDWDKN